MDLLTVVPRYLMVRCDAAFAWCGSLSSVPCNRKSICPPTQNWLQKTHPGRKGDCGRRWAWAAVLHPPAPQRFAVHQPLSRTSGRFFPVAYVSQSQFLLLAARELQLFRTCGPQRGLRRSGENTVLIERTRRSKRQPHFTSGMGRWTLMEHEAKRVLPAASGATRLWERRSGRQEGAETSRFKEKCRKRDPWRELWLFLMDANNLRKW